MYCNTKICTLFQPLGDTQHNILIWNFCIPWRYIFSSVWRDASPWKTISAIWTSTQQVTSGFYPYVLLLRTNLLKQAFLYCFHQHKFCLFSKRNIGKPTSVLWIFRLWIFFFVNVCRRCFHVVVGYKMSLLPMISVWYLISWRILLPFVYPVSCRIPAMTSDIWPDTGYD